MSAVCDFMAFTSAWSVGLKVGFRYEKGRGSKLAVGARDFAFEGFGLKQNSGIDARFILWWQQLQRVSEKMAST